MVHQRRTCGQARVTLAFKRTTVSITVMNVLQHDHSDDRVFGEEYPSRECNTTMLGVRCANTASGKGFQMAEHGFSRRHFFYGALLAGAVPTGGFGSTPSLQRLGYKSPNEKLNLAAIGAGGQPAADLHLAQAGVENVVALADVDWVRGKEGFERFPDAKQYKDFRQMLDKQGKEIDAVVIGTPDHMHATCALACMQLGKHVYVEKPLTRTAWEARLLAQAADEVQGRDADGQPGLFARRDARGLRDRLVGRDRRRARGARLDGTPQLAAGDDERRRRQRRCPKRSIGTCGWAARRRGRSPPATRNTRRSSLSGTSAPAASESRRSRVRLLSALQLARLLRFRQRPDRRLGRAHPGARQLGAATGAGVSDQRGVHQEGHAAAVHVPRRDGDQVRVRAASGRHAAGDGVLVSRTRAATPICRRA